MESQSSNNSVRSSTFYEPAWRNTVNGKLIRFSNKICKCYMRADLKISESDDNPHMLYYRCAKKNGCGYFKWWAPNRDDFNNGALFEGCVSTDVCYAVLSRIENDVKTMKTIVEKSRKSTKVATVAKVMVVFNVLFFLFNVVMYLM